MKIPMKRLILALTLVFTLLFSISFATANTAKSKTPTNTATVNTFLQTDFDFVISQDNFTKENAAFVKVNASISKESKSVNDYSYIPEAIANTTYNRQSAIVNRQSKKQVNGLNYYRPFNNFTNKLNQKLFLRACLSRASPVA